MPAERNGPKIKWDNHPKMRLAIVVIREVLKMSSRDCVKVMNVAFANEMVASGYAQGLPEEKSDTLQSQYRERNRVGNESKWRFDQAERKEMIRNLREIATTLGLDMAAASNAAQEPEDGVEDGAQVAGGVEGRVDEEQWESEPEDGEREDAGSDEDFSYGRASARARRGGSAPDKKDTRTARARGSAPSRNEKTTTGGVKVGKSRKKAATAIQRKEAPTRRQPKREPKLQQSAMSKDKKFNKTEFDPIGEPGFAPMESTTDFFGQAPIKSPFVIGDPEDARPRYESGEELSDIEAEEDDQAPDNFSGNAQGSNPILIDSDADSSSLEEGEHGNGGDNDENKLNYNTEEVSTTRPREQQDDSDSDFMEPGKKQPGRPARIEIEGQAKANELEKRNNDKGKKMQKCPTQDIDDDNQDEDEDNVVVSSKKPSARPPKGKGRAIAVEEPGQKQSGNSQKSTSENMNEVNPGCGDLSSLPGDQGAPQPSRKKTFGGKRGSWVAVGKKRPSNFEED